MRLTADVITYTVKHVPKWNPTNVCSYHLQEAGATPVQEVAYALATAIAMLDTVRDVGRSSSASELARRRRADQLLRERRHPLHRGDLQDARVRRGSGTRSRASATASTDAKLRRFRYGVQVNSLGLTEAQPENNVQRIVLEALGVTLSRDARCRALQLPAWNEALGLPRPWDQQWSLRIQQILAFETDILEYEDIFDGSHVIEAQGRARSTSAARAELDEVLAHGRHRAGDRLRLREAAPGALPVRAPAPHRDAASRSWSGVNRFTESAPSPLAADGAAAILKVDADGRAPSRSRRCARIARARNARRGRGGAARLCATPRAAARTSCRASIRCAHAGVTTGEWAGTLREIFGSYRAPTGISRRRGARNGERSASRDGPRARARGRGATSAARSRC